jgi:exopolysaccharide biosynthesis predicted pyruvyltransferase EpsI
MFLKEQRSILKQTTVPITVEQNRISNNTLLNRKAALWHAGGNWGNLYRWVQDRRIHSFEDLLVAGYDPIIGMPQSLYYSKALGNQEYSDAEGIAKYIARAFGLVPLDESKNLTNTKTGMTALQVLGNYTSIIRQKIIFTWREKSSYEKGLELYPFATNLLVPDIAFQIGPFNGTEYKLDGLQEQQQRRTETGRTGAAINATDIVFFLRADKESIYANIRKNTKLLQTMVNKATQQSSRRATNDTNYQNLTFVVYDWNSRRAIFPDNNHYFTHTAIELLASGKVVIVDRLHAGILSYLSGLPLILLDNVSKKINQTLGVAFDTWEDCYDNEHGMYASATNLSNAIQLAVEFIDKYYL